MRDIKVKLAAAHEPQYKNFDVKKEVQSVQEYVNRYTEESESQAIQLMFLKGIYDDFTRRMKTAMVFINTMGKPIRELHGVIRLKVGNSHIRIAKITIDFDESFMGIVNDKEAILVHLNIPVKGVDRNCEFGVEDLVYEFDDVKVTYENEEEI